MNQFFVLAWLPGQDHHKRVVMLPGKEKVVSFWSWQSAQEWCVDYLTPDWEWVIVPMSVVEIHADEIDPYYRHRTDRGKVS